MKVRTIGDYEHNVRTIGWHSFHKDIKYNWSASNTFTSIYIFRIFCALDPCQLSEQPNPPPSPFNSLHIFSLMNWLPCLHPPIPNHTFQIHLTLIHLPLTYRRGAIGMCKVAIFVAAYLPFWKMKVSKHISINILNSSFIPHCPAPSVHWYLFCRATTQKQDIKPKCPTSPPLPYPDLLSPIISWMCCSYLIQKSLCKYFFNIN